MKNQDPFDLKGRAALVTGSSRGIGRAIALGLAAHGADVAIHSADQREEAERVAKETASLGVKACAIVADFAADDGPRRVFDESVAALGRVDILVLNASAQPPRREWHEVKREEFDLQMRVNVRASLELIQLAARGMIERRWGRVLTIGSVQQMKPHPAMLAYAASKAAQLNMVRSLAGQFAPHGVTINNLAPGAIETARNTDALKDAAYRQLVLSKIPAGRLGQPEDCVGAALLLCSDAGSYITAADLFVDGGMQL